MIEVAGAAKLYHTKRDTKLIPVEMSPGSAVFAKSRAKLELGEAVDMEKGEAVQITAAGVFIYVTK